MVGNLKAKDVSIAMVYGVVVKEVLNIQVRKVVGILLHRDI